MLTINASEFAERRKQLLKQIGKGSVAILTAAPSYLRNGDVEYPYRQDSYFFYLTGFIEPEAIAVFIPERQQGEYVLFSRPRDPLHEIWHGHRAGQDGARRAFGADEAFEIEAFDQHLPDLLRGCNQLYSRVGHDSDWDARLMQGVNQLRTEIRQGEFAPEKFITIDPLLAEMRLHKSPAEIRMMREAAKISAKAHRRAMLACKPGLYEYQLEAELTHEFIANGARSVAYPSIVGGGANACTLHYTDNNAELHADTLVLIDAGCEYDHYASDITRTFPVTGRFTEPQKAIYNLVLAAQLATIECVKPGTLWSHLQETAIRVITEGLINLGILHGDLNALIEARACSAFYMHGIGHWLGLDVHDVGTYKIGNQWRPLEPGFVLTVEPGIYIPANTQSVDKKWWNIGVRIEDDVLVTEHGHEILSADVPKTVAFIEALMTSNK